MHTLTVAEIPDADLTAEEESLDDLLLQEMESIEVADEESVESGSMSDFELMNTPAQDSSASAMIKEPSVDDLAELEKEVQQLDLDEFEAKSLDATSKDLLAHYMEELSFIPLFTPEKERLAAEKLLDCELAYWRILLMQSLSYDVLKKEQAVFEQAGKQALWQMIEFLFKNKDNPHKFDKLSQEVYDLAHQLRQFDCDKEMSEKIIAAIRRLAWSSQTSKQTAPYYQNPDDILEIEQKRGDALRARNDFVRANLRLVVSVARSFHNVKLPLIDLIQEGNVGLMKAVHRYDHLRGFRFSTYAIWWIRQAIERAIINKGSAIRLPVHVIDARRQLSRTTLKLTQKFGRPPTELEIAKAMHLTPQKISQILAGVHQDPISLDDIISSDDPRKHVDLVRDENAQNIDESLIRENTQQKLRELLTLLSPIEKDIIKRRFGMYDGQDQTLDEIGKHYQLSRERVRQIQTQGLIKMRRMCERRKISTR